MTNTELKPGDVIGFSGVGFVSNIVNLATWGIPHHSLSHVGIMGEATDGRLLLFESTTLSKLPCLIQGKLFDGAQAHDLNDLIRIYRGKVFRYSLYRSLYEAEQERLTEYLMKIVGTPYDKMGAMRSAGVGISWIESLLPEKAMTSVYCSEWTSNALEEIGLCPEAGFHRYNPNRLMRHLKKLKLVKRPVRLK